MAKLLIAMVVALFALLGAGPELRKQSRR